MQKIRILLGAFFIGILVSCSYKNEEKKCVELMTPEYSEAIPSEKHIYMFDVSKSMIGQGNIETSNIFELSKQKILRSISGISNLESEIVVIPFSDVCYPIIKGNIDKKDSLLTLVDEMSTMPGNTNIHIAMNKAYSELDQDKVNSIYLISDGLHNEGATESELYEEADKWNNCFDSSNYLFFCGISPKAEVLLDISKKNEKIILVDSLNASINYITGNLELLLNDSSLIEGMLTFSSNNKDLLNKVLSPELISLQENKYYEMDSVEVNEGQIKFYLRSTSELNSDTLALKLFVSLLNEPVVFLPNAFTFSVCTTDCDEGMYVLGEFPMWILWLILAIILILLLLYILRNVGGIPIPGFGGIRIPKIPPLNYVVMPTKNQEDKPKKCEEEEWRMRVKRETGWPMSEVICYMNSEEEAEIYMKAKLEATQIGGRWALIRPEGDIDWGAFNCRKDWLKEKFSDYDKWKDYNNADLIGEGYPPRDENGDPYELHHIGQKQNSPFAELRWHEHMGDGNNKILHPRRESEIDRQLFDKEKSDYWQARLDELDPKIKIDIWGEA